MDRRQFLAGSAAALCACPALAQDAFPARPITILNAFPPGGANDLVTRPAATALEAIFKQPVVVETKAGAAGAVGAQVAATAKPDGYTLLSHNNGLAGYAAVDQLFGRQPKTTRADFIPLARLSADPVLLLVNEQTPWKTLEEFIADAKKSPEKIVYSSGGLYGASHLPVAMIEKAFGAPRMRHLPTNGGGPAITSVLGNNAQMTTQTGQASYQHVKAGKLRALASFGEQRSKTLPDVPTLKEKGFDVVYYLWVGLFAIKGTSAPILSTLTSALDKAGTSPQFTAAITNLGLEPTYQPAAEFAKFWEEDAKRSDEAVNQIGKVQG
jgi:tripartite-type tricarboxylate transporter receptor subunit TctC